MSAKKKKARSKKALRREAGEQTREKILDACLTLFAKHGYDATGMDAIARKARVTKSLIYYYFKKKRDILTSIIKRFNDAGIKLKKEQAKTFYLDPRGNLNDMLDVTLDFMFEHRDVLRVMLVEAVKESKDFSLIPHLDTNLQAGLEILAEHGTPVPEQKVMPLYFAAFFMVMIPLATFVVFGDQWCREHDVDLAWARKTLSEEFGHYYFSLLERMTT